MLSVAQGEIAEVMHRRIKVRCPRGNPGGVG